MTAATNTKLGGAKKRASGTPGAKSKRVTAKEIGTQILSTAGIKEEKTAIGMAPETDGVSQASTDNETVATMFDESSEPVRDSATNETRKSAGAKKPSGRAVKALTEAGKKRLVNKLLGLAETQATQGGFKITPADLIRLMQLHKEMTPQRERKVTVQWIEDKAE